MGKIYGYESVVSMNEWRIKVIYEWEGKMRDKNEYRMKGISKWGGMNEKGDVCEVSNINQWGVSINEGCAVMSEGWVRETSKEWGKDMDEEHE